MGTYQVIGNIKRGGKLLPRNRTAQFDDIQGERLVRDGYLARVDATPAGGETNHHASGAGQSKEGGNGAKDGSDAGGGERPAAGDTAATKRPAKQAGKAKQAK